MTDLKTYIRNIQKTASTNKKAVILDMKFENEFFKALVEGIWRVVKIKNKHAERTNGFMQPTKGFALLQWKTHPHWRGNDSQIKAQVKALDPKSGKYIIEVSYEFSHPDITFSQSYKFDTSYELGEMVAERIAIDILRKFPLQNNREASQKRGSSMQNQSVRELEMAFFREIVDRCKYALVADSVELTTKGKTGYEAIIYYVDDHRVRLFTDNPFNSLELTLTLEEKTHRGWDMVARKTLDIGYAEAPTRVADRVANSVY